VPTTVARVLLVGPQHTDPERTVLSQVGKMVEAAGHQAVTPTFAASPNLLGGVRTVVQGCDACIAVLDGSPLDASNAWLLGYAHAMRRPVLGLRSDLRAEEHAVPPQLKAALTDLVKVRTFNDPDLQEKLAAFLSGVRIFAGALVRDAVPKLLKDQGQDLAFRQVTESEYPHVLKRKLVETAQRLEETEFGLEQEEIADVLELLETLINIRKYDRESLRSIKEGKWRKRGGFQKGYLVDEEPVISSR
jgi:predicted house-cleaning noncanonical NTP pyrophosphatase (MazG superfamily)